MRASKLHFLKTDGLCFFIFFIKLGDGIIRKKDVKWQVPDLLC